MQTILHDYLYHHIPISQSFGITVAYAALDKVILNAPLQANINHKKTVFGGSLHAVATLSCWGLLFLNTRKLARPIELVIQSSRIDYLIPVTNDFSAECILPSSEIWERFEKMLIKKGKARIELAATIYHQEQLAVNFIGNFAALKN